MAIEIYAYEPAPSGALFPPRGKAMSLHAIAPLEQRDKVEKWCSDMNKEAETAGVLRRFKYQVTAVEMWRTDIEQELRQKLEIAETQLTERKVVERAKGLLMARNGLSEDDAYRWLRQASMRNQQKMVDVAQQLLDVAS